MRTVGDGFIIALQSIIDDLEDVPDAVQAVVRNLKTGGGELEQLLADIDFASNFNDILVELGADVNIVAQQRSRAKAVGREAANEQLEFITGLQARADSAFNADIRHFRIDRKALYGGESDNIFRGYQYSAFDRETEEQVPNAIRKQGSDFP